MQSSATLLKMILPQELSIISLRKQIQNLLSLNSHNEGARVRLSVFRQDGGFYTPTNNNAYFIIESTPLENETYQLNKEGLYAGFFKQMHKQCNPLSSLKSSNAQLYVMAGLYAGEQGWHDAIILNDHGFVAETVSSNLFMVKDGVLYTPDLDQACVAGILRMQILDIAARKGIKLQECAILPEDLLQADEVFITNSIKGINWIKGIGNKRYYHSMATQMMSLLQKETLGYRQDYITP